MLYCTIYDYTFDVVDIELFRDMYEGYSYHDRFFVNEMMIYTRINL